MSRKAASIDIIDVVCRASCQALGVVALRRHRLQSAPTLLMILHSRFLNSRVMVWMMGRLRTQAARLGSVASRYAGNVVCRASCQALGVVALRRHRLQSAPTLLMLAAFLESTTGNTEEIMSRKAASMSKVGALCRRWRRKATTPSRTSSGSAISSKLWADA
jgi:hypothetical protein